MKREKGKTYTLVESKNGAVVRKHLGKLKMMRFGIPASLDMLQPMSDMAI